MTRAEFVRMCSVLGMGLPLAPAFFSCNKDSPGLDFSGNVLIIGAGAGGLSAGYLLQQYGIDFQILEASGSFGGRMKIDPNFADFPIPLGAEWLETRPGIFREIVNDPSVSVQIETIPDGPDLKLVNYSWFNFFEDFIVPSIAQRISYRQVVQSVDYSGDKVLVQTQNGQFTADKLIVAVPLRILQERDIEFNPALPAEKQLVIDRAPIWAGFKAFFEFSSHFYGDGQEIVISPPSDGQKIFYDAAYGHSTTRHILGLFTVGKPALEYLPLQDEEIKEQILDELDGLYNFQARPHYIKHISQHWNKEPFIKGGYLSDFADWRDVKMLGEPVGDIIFFAGGAYTDGEDWVSVHAAAQSAKKSVEHLLFG